MTTWANNSKNTTTFTNQSFGIGDITWNEATFAWNDASGTWNAPRDSFVSQTKNTTTFTNQSIS